MQKPSRNPLSRWRKLTEEVERALQRNAGNWGGKERTLPTEVTRRIVRTLGNSRLPGSIADLCILSGALENFKTTNPDVQPLFDAVHGLWSFKVLAAAAGVGDIQEYGI
jgi:hypothetical protein